MHPLLLPVTLPLSLLYRLAIRRRNRRFDTGKGVERFDIPVISVGNMTVGGTGKSPLVRWICGRMLETGRRPVIAMRGYKSTDPGESDEAMEHREHFGDRVPIVAHPDRTGALKRFLPDHPETDCIVLDDGFQHRFIARDLDLVLVDASQRTLKDRLIPAGRLREPPENLARADGVIISHADERTATLDQSIERFHSAPPLAAFRHHWPALDVYESTASAAQLRGADLLRLPTFERVRLGQNGFRWRRRSEPPEWLDGQDLAVCLGTGNPRAVERMVRLIGGVIRTRMKARDHQRYDARFLARLRKACTSDPRARPPTVVTALFTTPKDWMKLRELIDPEHWPVRIIVPRLEIRFDEGEFALRTAILAVAQSTAAAR